MYGKMVFQFVIVSRNSRWLHVHNTLGRANNGNAGGNN